MSSNHRIAIIGFGKEGQSVLRYLKREPRYRNADLWVLDKNSRVKIPKGINAYLGKNYLKHLDRFTLVFRSPGVPWMHPSLVRARRAGVQFSSATKLFLDRCPSKIIGITGSKGKSTTSMLLYHMLKSSRKNVYLAGNIGVPSLDILPRVLSQLRRNPRQSALIVYELSSFQLQDFTRSPHIAVVLEIFPEHQDAHTNLREYYEAKANICRYQRPTDKVFFFADNALSKWIAGRGRGKKIAVRSTSSLFSPRDLKLRGAHSYRNAVMAATVAYSLGISKKNIRKTISTFHGLPHRLELVRHIRVQPSRRRNPRGRTASIKFYNDSASTNPQSAASAVRSFPGEPVVLIAGGQDKGLDYTPLAHALKTSTVKLVILYGENQKKIAAAVQQCATSNRDRGGKLSIVFTRNLTEAVRRAHRFALHAAHLSPATYHIVLSPASTSFDQFANYAERGEKFRKIVRTLSM